MEDSEESKPTTSGSPSSLQASGRVCFLLWISNSKGLEGGVSLNPPKRVLGVHADWKRVGGESTIMIKEKRNRESPPESRPGVATGDP